MFSRLITATGIFAIGYFVGREVGRMEILRELERARSERMPHSGTYDHEPIVEEKGHSRET